MVTHGISFIFFFLLRRYIYIYQLHMLTNWLTLGSIRISCITSLADTYALVLLGCTIRILSTCTWINALLLGAFWCKWAILILKALIGVTTIVGISLVIFQTCANSLVWFWAAYGILSTRVVVKAWVNTISLNTCFVKRAFQVMLASS